MAVKTWGVYQIQSKVKPERVYIGSSVRIELRWERHLRDLKYNRHGTVKLQRHYNKYGKEDLIFSIIEIVDNTVTREYLLAREQFYIDTLKPYFNTLPCATSRLGTKSSDVTKKRQSESQKKVKHPKWTEEHRANFNKSRKEGNKGNGMTGIPKPKEVCEKISNTLKGRKQPPRSEEHCKHLSEALMGRKCTPEHIEKMKEGNKNRKRRKKIKIVLP